MSDTPPDAPHASRLRRITGAVLARPGLLLLLLVFGAVVVMQWPMLKGMAYSALGVEPPESRIAWQHDYDAALEQARNTDRLVLVDFTADWCPPCQTMEMSTWPDDRVETLIENHFVPVKIDVDQPDHAPLMRTFNVQAIPTILILDAAGEPLQRGGYFSASDMAAFLKREAS